MSGLGFLLMILAPPLLGLVLGLLQLVAYLVLVKCAVVKEVPFFPLLWLRGMLLVVVLGVAMAIIQHLD